MRYKKQRERSMRRHKRDIKKYTTGVQFPEKRPVAGGFEIAGDVAGGMSAGGSALSALGPQAALVGALGGGAVALGASMANKAEAENYNKKVEDMTVAYDAYGGMATDPKLQMQQARDGLVLPGMELYDRPKELIEIEGNEKFGEIHTGSRETNYTRKNIGNTPHSKDGNKVYAEGGDVVFKTQHDRKKFDKIDKLTRRAERGDPRAIAALDREAAKLPKGDPVGQYRKGGTVPKYANGGELTEEEALRWHWERANPGKDYDVEGPVTQADINDFKERYRSEGEEVNYEAMFDAEDQQAQEAQRQATSDSVNTAEREFDMFRQDELEAERAYGDSESIAVRDRALFEEEEQDTSYGDSVATEERERSLFNADDEAARQERNAGITTEEDSLNNQGNAEAEALRQRESLLANRPEDALTRDNEDLKWFRQEQAKRDWEQANPGNQYEIDGPITEEEKEAWKTRSKQPPSSAPTNTPASTLTRDDPALKQYRQDKANENWEANNPGNEVEINGPITEEEKNAWVRRNTNASPTENPPADYDPYATGTYVPYGTQPVQDGMAYDLAGDPILDPSGRHMIGAEYDEDWEAGLVQGGDTALQTAQSSTNITNPSLQTAQRGTPISNPTARTVAGTPTLEMSSEFTKIPAEEAPLDYTTEPLVNLDETAAETPRNKRFGSFMDGLRKNENQLRNTLASFERIEGAAPIDLNLERYKYQDMSQPARRDARRQRAIGRSNVNQMIGSRGQATSHLAQQDAMIQNSMQNINEQEVGRKMQIENMNVDLTNREIGHQAQDRLRIQDTLRRQRATKRKFGQAASKERTEMAYMDEQRDYMRSRDSKLLEMEMLKAQALGTRAYDFDVYNADGSVKRNSRIRYNGVNSTKQ